MDWNHDGKYDWKDDAFYNNVVSDASKQKSSKPIDDFCWADDEEDSCLDYSVFPEDYETEEEYLEALEDLCDYAEEYFDNEVDF